MKKNSSMHNEISVSNEASFCRALFKKQQGVSSMNLLVYICFGAVLLTGVLKVLPVYMENKKIQGVLERVALSFEAEGNLPSKAAIKKKLSKSFAVESVSAIGVGDVVYEREGKTWTLDAGYEKRVELYNNIALVIDFTETNKYQMAFN